MVHINYHNITHDDMNNGDGLRVVLWLSGCSHHCHNCQNPQTWNPDSGIPFDESAKQEIFNELSKDYISGITFSGGDPLHENNLNGVLELIQQIRISFPEKTIWLYTGYKLLIDRPESHRQHKTIFSFTPNSNSHPIYDNNLFSKIKENERKRSKIAELVDIIIDGEYIDDQKELALKWRGSKNQRVIDIKKSLTKNKIILYCD